MCTDKEMRAHSGTRICTGSHNEITAEDRREFRSFVCFCL